MRNGLPTIWRSPASPSHERRSVGISIKSDQQVNTHGFPQDFVDLAWGQWLGRGTARVFQRGRDAIVLGYGRTPNRCKSDWTALLSEILQGTADRIVSRLNSSTQDGSQVSALQRAIVARFACPQRYEHPVGGSGDRAPLTRRQAPRFRFQQPNVPKPRARSSRLPEYFVPLARPARHRTFGIA